MSTVLARRIIAVSPDRAFGHELETALQAVAGTVDVYPGLDSLGAGDPEAALCVIHLDGELARAPGELLRRPSGRCPVIAVLPRASLAAAVELMQASDRVAGIMVAEDLDPRRLAALAARILTDDLFGLDKVMAPGTQIHARDVGDHQEKSRCMALISEFAEQAGVPRRYREPIEQCLDEMMMNALYDAPVDARGKHLFAEIPTRVRITLRTEQRVVVQYACDGKQLAVSVRDAFGTLERRTVLRYLHKGLHAAQQIDRKAGGAGLGLYLMVSSASAVCFNVLPGIATEAVCMFDLEAPKLQLQQLGFCVQLDPAGRVAAGPSRVLPAGPLRRARRLAVLIAAIGVLLGILVVPRLFGGAGPAHPDAGANAAALATVELDSQPTGAGVAIDGKPMGSTPLALTSLVPGTSVSIVFERTGYQAATARLQVPGPGGSTRLVQPLVLSDELVRVRFVSRPPGAEVIQTGQLSTTDRTYTPAEVFVEANKVQRFTLTMPRHVPLVIEPFTPGRGVHALEKGGDLVEGATLRIEATLDGKVTVSGAPHCREVALPIDCTLAPGTYVVEYLGPSIAKVRRTVRMMGRDAIEKLELGVIEAAAGKLLQPGGLKRAVFEAGTHTVTVSGGAGTHPATVRVEPGATAIAN